MLRFLFHLLLLVIICTNFVSSYEHDYDFTDFERLQAAQRMIGKKNEGPIQVPYSAADVQKALRELKQDYSEVSNWPTPSRTLGAISAVSLDVNKNIIVFHRAERVWDSGTFDNTNIFLHRNLGPIQDNTIVKYDRETGNVMTEWGKNMFYLPHGLHINGNYYYITDVALHQVFRFNIQNSTTKPELTLGEAFKPGRSAKLFCKPTSVATLDNGDFFVADGYCNSRIVKFNFAGEKILEWGKASFSGPAMPGYEPPNAFAVPHALTLVPDKGLLCVADRENGRVQCFSTEEGKYVMQFHSPIVGDRLFSVAYANGTLFVVNGPEFRQDVIEIRGYTFNMKSGDVTSKFGSFLDPHDLTVTSDAKEIYVADLTADKNGHRLHKFMLNGLKPTRTSGDNGNLVSKTNVHRGDTALLVGSIVLLFTVFTIGLAILISRKQRRGNKSIFEPWNKTTKNIFFDYNQFEKIPQNDDFIPENQNEFA